ncbi:MAG: TIGR01841 family phasin [Proteobacteria bacterium]|nr:TIGR01841 family phasin [Pseudomonadota bacterium]
MAKDSKDSAALNPFGDVTKLMEQFKLPGVDMSALMEARRKDVEALVEANKAAYASLQAIAQKQTEMLTEAMHGIQQAMQNAATGGLTDPTRQTELAREAWTKALNDMKTLAEMACKSQSDMVAGISQRATQSVEEIRKMMQPK